MLERIRLFLASLDTQSQAQAPLDFATALGALMVEVMRADNEIAPDELTMIAKLLRQHCQLSEQSSELIRTEAQRLVDDAIDLHRFVKVVNDHTDEEERIEVIELLWMVAFADGKLDPQEDYTVRKLAGLMYVAHGDFIAAKLNVKEVLGLAD
ncbi:MULTISPECIES: TerB family tellurite resistance protein [Pseudoalteromonas]|uniref:TerB family tellurite resistance protein n=1 Tax=Pseudoalteromonas obscura TaxID=3048491 RepID=A0ABT7ET04_9GAMM|nr:MULTISPECIES: TerB family tellurite resistance protein [Pseudoalteromonas]MBQ4839283.1 TerB family tellurite resistance protein [Pseudoalteromonas luteoviolacea]MDK2598124.1 TerB family tellurite resistance protein [Pseudoalteromonas sp. P94(2023)]